MIRERKRAKQDSIENVMEQNRREEFNSYQEEKPQVNPIEHFARRYIFSDDGIGVEVLPDGRVLQISHIIATGEETKNTLEILALYPTMHLLLKAKCFSREILLFTSCETEVSMGVHGQQNLEMIITELFLTFLKEGFILEE